MIHFLFVLLMLLVSQAYSQDFLAHVLCADSGDANSNVNVHYFTPLTASTINPTDPSNPPIVDFNSSVSKVAFHTLQRGWNAYLLHRDRRDYPLSGWMTGTTQQFFSYNMTNDVLIMNWGVDISSGFPGRLTHVASSDQYWGFTGVNNINQQGNTYVLNIYGNVLSSTFNGNPAFSTSWTPAATQLIENDDITSDSVNQVVYVALAETTNAGNLGLLITYDIKAGNITSQVTYGASSRIKFSAKRKALFSAQIDGSGARIFSIEEVDPTTGRSRVLIANTSMPQLQGMYLDNTFDDDSGEWYFAWTTNDKSGATKTSFFSINIDTKKVTQPVALVYDWSRVKYLGLVIKSVTPSYKPTTTTQWQ